MVETTSNLALVNTQTFDSATSTYTLYVGSEFDQIGVSYDHAVTGNTTFTVNNITYDQRTTVPSTDLLFDVTAVDRDGDSSSASLLVDLLGGTNVASGLALSSTPSADALVGDSGNATLTDPFMATTISGTPQAVTTTNATAIISGTTTGFVLEAGGASPGTPTGTLTDTDSQNAQYLHHSQLADRERWWLRHFHDDGGWRVDLHARQRQHLGGCARCRRHADRYLHAHDRRRRRTSGDEHHPWQ